MTLIEIQALAAEGGFPLVFSYPWLVNEIGAVFIWTGSDEIVMRLPHRERPVKLTDLDDFHPADAWQPIGGFW